MRAYSGDDNNEEIARLRLTVEKLNDSARCLRCGMLKPMSQFYISTDPTNQAGITCWCKQCCKDVALRRDQYGNYHSSTVESVKQVLEHIDKPFIQSVWNASVEQAASMHSGINKTDTWMTLIKNLQMKQYYGLRWKDSDMFKSSVVPSEEEQTVEKLQKDHKGDDVYDSYVKNKTDVIRLLGYDPFQKQAITDQPFLYSQLLGMLDSSQDINEDMVRVSSAISIVRGFLQEAKIDDAITKLMGNTAQVADNSPTIKSLQDSKQKITNMITNLAAESCLSLKNSKTVTKGTNTWSGQLQKIRQLNLRQGQVNGFDINTCRGFQQVQQISDASIMKQLKLDESEWSDMVADMRQANKRLRKQRDSYKEINRILLRQNIDLKDTLKQDGVDVNSDMKKLKDMYSIFRDDEDGIEFTGEQEVDKNEPDNSSV